MIYRLVLRGAFAGMLLCALASAAIAQPITVDTNPQYFRFNNQTIPLVGFSGEYICHIANTAAADAEICTYGTYTDFIDELAAHGLNKFRLWIGLNHSPGKMRQPAGQPPLDFEQPFKWESGQWDLDQWEPEYFTRLKNVLNYARDKTPSIIVEVTFFDPWSGNFATSPWNSANIKQTAYTSSGGIGFTQRKFFVTYDNGTSDLVQSNQNARARQFALVDKIAEELKGYNNVFYEIANEPDINASNGVTGTNVATWHGAMVQRLYDYEGTHAISRHLIAVNFHTPEALATVRSTTHSNRRAKVVSSHYAGLADSGRYSAIRMINNYHNGGVNELNRAFGFNETKAISNVPSPSSPDGARVEAWEFMLNEGGTIDHYNLNWHTSDADTVRQYLQVLKNFLTPLPLGTMQRTPVGPGAWIQLTSSTLCNVTALGTTCPWTAAMAQPTVQAGQQHVFYFHYSRLNTDSFAHYVPSTASRTITVQVNPSGGSATFQYQWINPKTGNQICAVPPCTPATFAWPGSGGQSLTSPSFTQDIALRLTRQ